MFPSAAHEALKSSLIAAIEKLRHEPALWQDGCLAYDRLFHNLELVEEMNVRADSYCGMASGFVLEFLPGILPSVDAVTVTASAQNGCFHHYNLVRGDGETWVCDLTAGQFFSKPMTVFGGRPYFVGTRDELKALVAAARENTWQAVARHFPGEFRNLWEVDLAVSTSSGFLHKLNKILRAEALPCLMTESLYYPWECTWGDAARLLQPRKYLGAAFAAVAGIEGLRLDTTPKINKLVNVINADSFTRQDAPGI